MELLKQNSDPRRHRNKNQQVSTTNPNPPLGVRLLLSLMATSLFQRRETQLLYYSRNDDSLVHSVDCQLLMAPPRYTITNMVIYAGLYICPVHRKTYPIHH
jgi:hypothetical protein